MSLILQLLLKQSLLLLLLLLFYLPLILQTLLKQLLILWMHRTSMSIGSIGGGNMIGTSRTAPLMYSPLFEVVEAEVKNDRQALAEEQAEEQVQKVVVEEQAGEQKKKVMVEEAGVEWEVEMESASDAFAEHEDVQCDDVECLDIDLLKQQRGDDDGRRGSQEHVGHVQPDGQQSMHVEERLEEKP
ncbi:hypothetical protein HD554DRAFT_2267770 [Boletus coccyginus]|nr:hypothetical protein HD554DRAFT_2041067 [Boletus coccyginus]KAI9567417.1 hypothetical protein HD554DRAFT_2267770 [Boletus coccyginus]